MKTFHYNNLTAVSEHFARVNHARQVSVKLLCDAYYMQLCKVLTPEQIRKVRSVNLASGEEECASANVVDLRDVMSTAFVSCFDRFPALEDNEENPDQALCADAWVLAKQLYLTGAEA